MRSKNNTSSFFLGGPSRKVSYQVSNVLHKELGLLTVLSSLSDGDDAVRDTKSTVTSDQGRVSSKPILPFSTYLFSIIPTRIGPIALRSFIRSGSSWATCWQHSRLAGVTLNQQKVTYTRMELHTNFDISIFVCKYAGTSDLPVYHIL